jgi:hypothetical protein
VAQSRQRTRKFPTYEIESVSAYVGILEDIFPDTDDLLFRGQRQDWPLLPKIARITIRPGMDLPTAEQSLLEEFKLRAPSFVDLEPQTDWEWLSLAQHYGMPTRLLDWTSNPLAALWFAVQLPAKDEAPAVVWAFDPGLNNYVTAASQSSPFSVGRTRVLQPKHIARRIIAQSGWFTVHKYIRGKGFVPLDHQGQYTAALKKILVPARHFARVRYGLGQCGVNAASMLTDLTGIASHIEWRHARLHDESEDVTANPMLQRTPLKRRG